MEGHCGWDCGPTAQLQSRHETSMRRPPPEKQMSHKKANTSPGLESCSLRAKCSQSLWLPSKEQATRGKRRCAGDSEKFPNSHELYETNSRDTCNLFHPIQPHINTSQKELTRIVLKNNSDKYDIRRRAPNSDGRQGKDEELLRTLGNGPSLIKITVLQRSWMFPRISAWRGNVFLANRRIFLHKQHSR